MPHVMHKSFISGRGETERLARTNESLQKKVDILEVRLKEQEGLIAAQGTRRAAASDSGAAVSLEPARLHGARHGRAPPSNAEVGGLAGPNPEMPGGAEPACSRTT